MVSTYLIFSFFFVWLLLTIIAQFNGSASALIRRCDFFSLIPSWTFFAPTPGTFDYAILTRERSNDGALGKFKEVYVVDEHGLLKAIWNPNKRKQKTIIDAAQTLISCQSHLSSYNYLLSTPYLIILNYVLFSNIKINTQAIQFLIAVVSNYSEEVQIEVAFISSFHPV